MKLQKDPDQPVVTVVYDRRTTLDRRKKLLLEGPWLRTLLSHAGAPSQQRLDELFFELKDEATGVSRVTAEDRGVFKYCPGRYGVGASPCTIRSTVSGTTHNAEAVYDRLFGDKKAPLDELRVPEPSVEDFVAVRFRGDKAAVSDSFVRAAAMHDADEFGADDFEALWLRAYTAQDAADALVLKAFDGSWWQPVEVDSQRRPLTRWVEGVRWTATDEAALEEAQSGMLAERERELKRQLRLTEQELRREMGL